eukprot:TRINITY_DN2238_c0_g1::TRINITY_DN2238_c0_g1_i1::g.6698::m.6698 TRINITY_DN2238_c0_g1::TRINITY_DN2238_c0_g1_i1::g.6698  ORF type:complete len:305 (+),score=40.09 TRINITY_DN2238_c0_g1_i1:173-1087(+)
MYSLDESMNISDESRRLSLFSGTDDMILVNPNIPTTNGIPFSFLDGLSASHKSRAKRSTPTKRKHPATPIQPPSLKLDDPPMGSKFAPLPDSKFTYTPVLGRRPQFMNDDSDTESEDERNEDFLDLMILNDPNPILHPTLDTRPPLKRSASDEMSCASDASSVISKHRRCHSDGSRAVSDNIFSTPVSTSPLNMSDCLMDGVPNGKIETTASPDQVFQLADTFGIPLPPLHPVSMTDLLSSHQLSHCLLSEVNSLGLGLMPKYQPPCQSLHQFRADDAALAFDTASTDLLFVFDDESLLPPHHA